MQSLVSLEYQSSSHASTFTDNNFHAASPTTLVPTSASRKRKASDHDEPYDHAADTQVFKGNLLSNRGALSFAAIALVARACLPLAWLNFTASALVFQADIPSVQDREQRVLIARKVPHGRLYAIEKVAVDSYVACSLHVWVTEDWCHDAAVGRIAEIDVEDLLLPNEEGSRPSHSRTGSRSESVSNSTGLPTPKSPRRPKNRRGAMARISILAPRDGAASLETTCDMASPLLYQESMMDMKRSRNPNSPSFSQQPFPARPSTHEPPPLTSTASTNTQNTLDISTAELNPSTISETAVGSPSDPPIPNPVVDNPISADRLRTQYLEQLYTTKTSLAFYVKGPLSRARAHIRTARNASTSIQELSEIYEQSIIPTKKIDLKFKDSLPKIVKDLPVAQMLDDEASRETKKKARKRKTVKLGKDCLWPDEENFVAKWWRGRDVHGTIASRDHAEEMRKELADLRMRETMMQMLLILEVMLLETAASTLAESDKVIAAESNVKVESVDKDSSGTILASTTPRKQPKKEKKRDWVAEVDSIVDRLCIWHTVSLEDLSNPSNDKSSEPQTNGSAVHSSKPNDSLRDFCKDILLPFYSAKLPLHIKTICRKLGGPERSPQRPKQPRPGPPATLHRASSSTSSLPKPRPGQSLSKRTLERVLSEDHLHLHLHRHTSPPPPALSTTTTKIFSRSNSISAPIVPTLKREPSDRPASRGGMLSRSVSFSNREIDLVADQKLHDTKRRKLDRLAQQKRELDAAIDALKKPDRRAAAGLIMDEVEERNRVEMERKVAVQISATPRKRNKGQSHLDEPTLPLMPRLVVSERDVAVMIPSSTVKPRVRSGLSSETNKPRSLATKRAVLAAIQETPSRGLGPKTTNPLHLPSVAIEIAEPTAITAIPALIDKHGSLPPSSALTLPAHQDPPSSSQVTDTGSGLLMSRSRRQVLFTPIKKSEVCLDQVFRDAPEIPEKAGVMMDRVMGGKGRGMDDGFESPPKVHSLKPRSMHPTKPNASSNELHSDGGVDIYDKLGWNDDYDL